MSVGCFEDLAERFADVRIADAVLIDQKPLEDAVVEAAAGAVVRLSVELTDVAEESKTVFEQMSSRRERSSAVGMLGFQTEAILAQLVDALADLVLRQAFLGEVKQALLALVEFRELLCEGVVQASQTGLFVSQRIAHRAGDKVGEVLGEVEGRVVLDHVVFDQLDRQARQVAQPLLAVDAEVVLVLPAVAGSACVDELAPAALLFTSVAVEELLQVVEVRAVAPRGGGALLEDLLHDCEQFRCHECLMAPLEQLALVAHEAHVVRVGEHGVPLVH